MMTIFVILQCLLFLFMVLYDFASLPPVNGVDTLRETDTAFNRLLGSIANGFIVLIPLCLTLIYFDPAESPLSAKVTIVTFYIFLTVGTILSWWKPYFSDGTEKHKLAFIKFKKSHRSSHSRRDKVVPNTLHIILHLQVWTCLVLSIMLYFQ